MTRSVFLRCIFILLIIFTHWDKGISQHTLGVAGLLNSPSADFSADGTVKIGGSFINKHLSPASFDYNTFNYYLNATFLLFFGVAITSTAFKNKAKTKFINEDRAICIRLRLLKERRYWPSIALGSNDAFTQVEGGSFGNTTIGNKYFGTTYLAVSKHSKVGNNDLGAHIAYNILLSNKRAHLDFPVSGGISFTPGFYDKLNFITEYDTRNFNIGANAVLIKYIFIQFFVQKFRYPSAGMCFQFYW